MIMKRCVSINLRFLVLLALLLQGAPAGNAISQSRKSGELNMSPETWPKDELEKCWRLQRTYFQSHPAAESSQGMVAVTSEAFAARAGLEALRQGGSAADAALAAALAQVALTAGSEISYAGILTMVYYDAAGKKVYSLNAGYNTVQEEKDPRSIPGMGQPSGRAVLVPGFFAGAQAAHDRFGKLPFASLFEPAIYLAEKGFVMDGVLGRRIYRRKGVITRLPEMKRVFTKENGELYREGDLFKQPQLAETLRKVATQGASYIYQGEWAKKFVEAVQSEGGEVTLKDMNDYRAIWSEPTQTNYHGYRVYSLGLPSGGGVDAIEALNLLEAADLKQYGHYTASPEALYEFIQICRASIYLNNFPPELFKEYAPEIALAPVDRVKKENARLLWQKMHEPAWQKMLSVVNPKSDGNKHSAGVVAVDARGNVAALAHSINTFDWGGSGIFVDGVSIPDSASFQQGKIAWLKPGDRLPDPSVPVIVLKDSKPYLASSSIGSALHPTTMNNLVNVLDFGMDLKKSIDTPNFMGPFFGIGFAGGPTVPQVEKEALAEGDFDENLVKAVLAKGQALKLLSKGEAAAQRGYWVAIQIDPKTGKRVGVAPSWLNGYVTGH
jgi:gamma-glutamyltranspeptidase / glutathione hydrolase